MYHTIGYLIMILLLLQESSNCSFEISEDQLGEAWCRMTHDLALNRFWL